MLLEEQMKGMYKQMEIMSKKLMTVDANTKKLHHFMINNCVLKK